MGAGGIVGLHVWSRLPPTGDVLLAAAGAELSRRCGSELAASSGSVRWAESEEDRE